jgi:signal-transduction protein with cAMP-binding, CBS, and nucleotidyltransferase domain
MKAAELTVRAPVAVTCDASIADACEVMSTQGVGALIVLDDDRPVGIVTDRDIVTRGIAKRVPPDARVDSLMSMGLIAVDTHADLQDLMQVFTDNAIRRVAVVEHDRVVGVVSMDDILVLLANQLHDVTDVMASQIMFPRAGDEPPAPAAI